MKILIFDLDGTLFDTRRDIANAVNQVRKTFRLPILSLSQITTMVGHGVAELARRAFLDTSVDTAFACELILDYYKQHPTDTARLYPGVRETIPKLQMIRTIVSNKPKVLVDALLEKHRITRYFDFVAGGDTFEKRKPDPAAIYFLLDHYQVLPDQILVVGDHALDIQMAKQVPVQSVFCNYGFFGKDEVGADYQIDSFPELLAVLARISQKDS